MHNENLEYTNDNLVNDMLHVDENTIVDTTPRRSTRNKRVPAYLQDFETNIVNNNNVSTKYPVESFINYNFMSPNFKHTIKSISMNAEPQTYEEASKNPCWVQAMQEELATLEANQAWIMTNNSWNDCY